MRCVLRHSRHEISEGLRIEIGKKPGLSLAQQGFATQIEKPKIELRALKRCRHELVIGIRNPRPASSPCRSSCRGVRADTARLYGLAGFNCKLLENYITRADQINRYYDLLGSKRGLPRSIIMDNVFDRRGEDTSGRSPIPQARRMR
jgi:hypothetical protein